MGAKGWFVTVDATPHVGLPDNKIRVKFDTPEDIDVGGSIVPQPQLSDEEIMQNMREKFSVLDDMTYACCEGTVRGLIVTGPPGIGKSFGVERIVDEADVIRKLGDTDMVFGVEKGSASAIGLYQLLYKYSKPGSLLVLDDSDTVLYDETSLNLLKAALDSGRSRRLNWYSESNTLANASIPNTFEFKGSIIFITNLDFENTRGKIGAHLGALMSRCHYLDMGISDQHEKYLRCEQIVRDGMLQSYGFEEFEKREILDFIRDNLPNLRELSLRMVKKIADLRKMDAKKWRVYATNTCLRG